MTLRRRGFVRLCIGAGSSLLWPRHAAAASGETRYQKLLVRYRTDPDRIARALPPALSADQSGEAWFECVRIIPESAGPLFEGPYLAAGIRLAVEHGSGPGWFQPIRWTTHEWLRLWEREHLGFNTKRAEIDLTVEGASVKASLDRKGFRLLRVAALRTDRSVASSGPSAGRDLFGYRYGLGPDWQKATAGRSTGIWRIPEPAAPSDSLIRACDIESAALQLPHESPLDPIAEFPALEILAVTYEEGTAGHVPPSNARNPRFVSGVDASEFQSWNLMHYDRPHTSRRPWQPEDWPDEATAFRLSGAEIERYRSRREVRLGPVDMLDVRLTTTGQIKNDILPPPCRAGFRPALRMLVLRVEESDLSPVPFSEAWLFAFAVVERERGWYALSHIVSEGGDLTFGREVLGFPSKLGTPDLSMSFRDFSAHCVRRGRELLNAQGKLRGIPTGTSLSQIPVLGLRRSAAHPSASTSGEIVAQPWYFQGRHFSVDRSTVRISFPEPADEESACDPWFEFNPVRVASVSVMTNVTMQRTPGRVVAPVPDLQPYYRERCDGAIPGIDSPLNPAVPTFGVVRAPVTRS